MASSSIATRADRPLPTIIFALRLLLLAMALMFLLVPHLFYKLIRRPSPMVMAFLNVAGWISGLRIRTRGQRLRRNVLFIANHTSWLDILALGGAARSAFVSKAEIRDAPLIGWLANQNHTLYVEREARRDIALQTQQLRGALSGEKPITLFPEGTTGPGDQLLPFRPALMQAVVPAPAGLSVQPVMLDYGEDAPRIAWTDGEAGIANFRRILSRFKPIHLTIHYLAPLDLAAYPDRKALAEAARKAIWERMEEVQHPSANARYRL